METDVSRVSVKDIVKNVKKMTKEFTTVNNQLQQLKGMTLTCTTTNKRMMCTILIFLERVDSDNHN